MDVVARDHAKQIADMAAVLYEQGKDAGYILDAIDAYAVGAGLVPERHDQGAVEALRRIAEPTKDDSFMSNVIARDALRAMNVPLRSEAGGR